MKLFIVIALIAVVVVGYVFLKPSNNDTPAQQNESISGTSQFAAIQYDINNGASLYDVRTAGEFDSGHIEGATNFPVEKMLAGEMPQVDKGKKMYVYCRSGNRSAQAKAQLQKNGFTDVVDLGAIESVVKMAGKKV